MEEVRSQRFELKAMEACSRHKRSKSEIYNRGKGDLLESPSTSCGLKEDMKNREYDIDAEKKLIHTKKAQGVLKQEIMQLEKRLKDQLEAHLMLEKALGYRKTVIDSSNNSFTPKPAKELIREIAVLELEVMHLEQHLLSLYRKAFDQQIPTLSLIPSKSKSKHPVGYQRKPFHELPSPQISSKTIFPLVHSTRILPSQISACKLADESYPENITDRNVNRCHSALNQRTVYSSRISSSEAALARALQDCDSQPLSFLTDWHDSNSGMLSLAEYLGTGITDHVAETANKISEDLVKCMGAIYIKLADPPLLNPGPSSSPTSSLSSMSAISPQCAGDLWSPGCRNETILDTRLVNPFRVEGLKEFSGPYNSMVEVSSIRNDEQRLKTVEELLGSYKSLIHKLAAVNVKRMKNDEKLPFWVNLNNALIMHAYLVYGVPQSSMKRTSLLIKATCIVGGHSVNADMIQSSFLGCRTHWAGQWFRTFMLPVMKFKARDEWKRLYAIEKQEPLLHFALCSGSHSDPAVRIYSANKWLEQLETAKAEYIRATVGIQKEKKMFLPKLIEIYAKDSCMSSQKVVDMIQRHLPETLCVAIKRCQRGRSHKIIEWLPHNLKFRYLLSKEVVNPQIV
ncbi:uncharacterized protein LOC110017852 isoform X2 [Phalaenopsis equestris]|uniref:uncharacterized protein LOC110017852 isoform X2 n=1 Tax=Phalaenopsis equestris TaxID=78828 RepID=UPI0009E5FC12|nr:uncharacterized protein LOC110017852 isoform X2 [Phalaenopsis equestris]